MRRRSDARARSFPHQLRVDARIKPPLAVLAHIPGIIEQITVYRFLHRVDLHFIPVAQAAIQTPLVIGVKSMSTRLQNLGGGIVAIGLRSGQQSSFVSIKWLTFVGRKQYCVNILLESLIVYSDG